MTNLKKSQYWLEEKIKETPGFVLLDPDGWNRLDFNFSWEEEITKEEFENRLLHSTSIIDKNMNPVEKQLEQKIKELTNEIENAEQEINHLEDEIARHDRTKEILCHNLSDFENVVEGLYAKLRGLQHMINNIEPVN
jgi:chromosome segregation ATPase